LLILFPLSSNFIWESEILSERQRFKAGLCNFNQASEIFRSVRDMYTTKKSVTDLPMESPGKVLEMLTHLKILQIWFLHMMWTNLDVDCIMENVQLLESFVCFDFFAVTKIHYHGNGWVLFYIPQLLCVYLSEAVFLIKMRWFQQFFIAVHFPPVGRQLTLCKDINQIFHLSCFVKYSFLFLFSASITLFSD